MALVFNKAEISLGKIAAVVLGVIASCDCSQVIPSEFLIFQLDGHTVPHFQCVKCGMSYYSNETSHKEVRREPEGAETSKSA